MTYIIYLICLLLAIIIARMMLKKSHYKSEITTYSSGAQRMMDFIHYKGLIEEYKKYSFEKYGEKNDES